MKVGVLALQGAFAAHSHVLAELGAKPVEVREVTDLADVDALVMPGGESTTMIRLMDRNGLRPSLEKFVREMPVMGTCAGVILLGKDGERLPGPPLGVLDVSVERNAYGRQIDSFSDVIDAPVLGHRVTGVFIRAPRIRRVGPGVEVVARRGDEPVGVRSGRIVGLCFHPELTSDLSFHRWFLAEVAGLDVSAPAPGATPVAAARSDRA